ncbi:MAG TPA: glutamate--tRNA ligase family protein [Vicinamibacterales bacterium]|nr:glutamate--tRNA ligase family protein [Vicinamibacterales bacterium]
MRTRFAPAPTGFLHLGHVVNAIYVWGVARAFAARVVLRIEDHDRQRCRPEYEAALLDDLDWLGFRPDDYPTDEFRHGRCDSRQSDRGAIYESAAAELIERGLVYACQCSRQDLAQVDSDPVTHERRYAGTCRDRGLPLSADAAWRVRLDPGEETFDDVIVGAAAQDPSAQCGDVVIRDRVGNWTYQFVAAVDDLRQDITLVVRGLDLLPSTGRQIRLARLLGRTVPPTFAHHPLVMKSPDQKLSKSDGDTGIRDLRAAGWSSARVIAEAAARAGLAAPSTLSAADAADLAARTARSRRG